MGPAVIQRQAASSSPGRRTLVDQTYDQAPAASVQLQAAGAPLPHLSLGRNGADASVQMAPAPAAEADSAAGGAAGEAQASGAHRLVKGLPKAKPGGGVVADPDHPGVSAAAPLPRVPGPVQGEGNLSGDTDSVHAAAAHGISGSGGSLPHLAAIQASFGHHDVSGIQSHTDSKAAEGTRAMGAEAYATGAHVAFGSGTPSLHTAAHEAAHVVQQRGGVQLKGGVGQVGDAHEQHADAVADRVVQGKSAVDLLDAYGGGGGGGGEVQHQPVQRKQEAGTGGGSASASPAAAGGGGGGGTLHHYEVELKAWIPHARVVDPEEPARASDWLDTISSIAGGILDSMMGVNAKLMYEFHSYYRGDGHTGFAGGYRVLSKASFDYDGHTITGFRQVGTYGASHRDYDYRAWLELSAGVGPLRVSLGSVNVASGSGSETATATSATSGGATGATSFNLGMSSANPLVMTWAPTIDSEMTGTLDASGNMSISFTTDLFPSHGIQVTKDGVAIKTQVVNDPSGINALGPIGALDIGRRLTSHSNSGTSSAP